MHFNKILIRRMNYWLSYGFINAHYHETIDESERTLDELIKEGVNSIGWDLNKNVEVGVKYGHPNPDKLRYIRLTY